ncbi:lysophospholipase L1-like esterase [Rhizobium phage RL2RES]|uniref:Uncharacterized protein n=1 Tax=Rhizobium phage RL2RES TaxID=103371 RepID=A0A6B9J1L2_9CAUD|nr:lysophospholipase L1-like esterase [Rhizobium phage RL2RES]QGZ14114.1 hypothetical protein RL2RES_034 [Rhizobium phage RL2RES]
MAPKQVILERFAEEMGTKMTLNKFGSKLKMPTNFLQMSNYVQKHVFQTKPPSDPTRYMFFATRVRMNSGYIWPSLTGKNYMASKLKFGTPDYDVEDPLLHFSGWSMTEGGNAPQETQLPGNDVIIDAVELFDSAGVKYVMTNASNPGVTIPSGNTGFWFRSLTPLKLIKNTNFTVITKWHNNVGQNYVGAYRIQKQRGEKFWGAADGTALQALIDADAPVTTEFDVFYDVAPGAQNASQVQCFGPDMMVAKGDWDGRDVALILADSFGASRQEISATADARGNMGPLARALDDKATGRVAHHFMGCPGAKCQNECLTSALKRWDILDEVKNTYNGGTNYPFTIVANEMASNDASSDVPGTWMVRLVGLMNRVRTRIGASIPYWQFTVPPRNSTTASYSTAAAISVLSTLWSTNRNDLNTRIRNKTGYAHDGYLELDRAWTNYPTDPDKFASITDIWGATPNYLTNYTPGGGTSSGIFAKGTIDFNPIIGESYIAEYQTGTWGGRIVSTIDSVNPNGTLNVTFTTESATAFQATSKIYPGISPDGVHCYGAYYRDWVAPRLLAEKTKLHF